MSNQLATETSPYLLQHKDNPVEWYPWGPEALERARRENKPIFLSIGYSACHWCHVMEHESFEDPDIARLLNEHFVSIKVDREERPDLDHIYMNAVQILTGRGGWPMSVFLTPTLEPFFGGTYWPPTARMGMPGFDQVLRAVIDAWQNRQQEAVAGAKDLARRVQDVSTMRQACGALSAELIQSAVAQLERSFDFTHGGFGRAPKFPHPMDLQLLLRFWKRSARDGARQMVELTLDKMAAGGIYDQLGGGFARYSVDERWLVPHFEKMLYDNALLAGVYLDAYLAFGGEDHARVVRETLDYVLRDMTDPGGAFYSTEDADSEGEEGKFYVWRPEEIEQVLGAEAAKAFCYVYDVSPEGNFEGQNILNLPKTLLQCAHILHRDLDDLRRELQESRAKLFAAREQRIRPGRDDKVLASWNGLMIDSMARAGAALGEPRYVEAAAKAADFILKELRRDDGRLLHTWRRGQAKLDAYLDDYAALAVALVSVYEATFEERYMDEAARLADLMLELFSDEEAGGFFYTAADHEPLIARTKDLQDGSVPSGSSLAATALLRIGKLSGEGRYLKAAVKTMESAAGLLQAAPTAAGQMLCALDMHVGPLYEIALLGNPTQPDGAEVVHRLYGRYIPNRVVAMRKPDGGGYRSPVLDPLFAGKEAQDSGPTAYICQNFACQAPVSGPAALLAKWEELASAGSGD